MSETGLKVVRWPNDDSNGWAVIHESSGQRAFDGTLRQRRFAEEALAELLATGVDFTRTPKEIQRDSKLWREIYVRWGNRAHAGDWDRETGEYYPSHSRYGQFIPSAKWAAAYRALLAQPEPRTEAWADEYMRMLDLRNKAVRDEAA